MLYYIDLLGLSVLNPLFQIEHGAFPFFRYIYSIFFFRFLTKRLYGNFQTSFIHPFILLNIFRHFFLFHYFCSYRQERLQNSYPERRDELVRMLGIDLNWHMHQLSDGQRRRVQIMLGLVRPFKILLLDEITTSLDVCVRQDLLKWIVKESEERGATVLYATHIFDGLDDWATHLFYLTNEGKCGWQGKMSELEKYQELKRTNHPAKMLAIADHWLRKELEEARANKQFEKATYAAMELDPTDRQGGYASGRNIPMEETTSTQPQRRGTIADVMGNAGKLDQNRKSTEA